MVKDVVIQESIGSRILRKANTFAGKTGMNRADRRRVRGWLFCLALLGQKWLPLGASHGIELEESRPACRRAVAPVLRARARGQGPAPQSVLAIQIPFLTTPGDGEHAGQVGDRPCVGVWLLKCSIRSFGGFSHAKKVRVGLNTRKRSCLKESDSPSPISNVTG